MKFTLLLVALAHSNTAYSREPPGEATNASVDLRSEMPEELIKTHYQDGVADNVGSADLPVPKKLRNLLQDPTSWSVANRIGNAVSQALHAAWGGLAEALGGMMDSINNAGGGSDAGEDSTGPDKGTGKGEGPQGSAQGATSGARPAEDQQQSAPDAGDRTDHVDDLEDAGASAAAAAQDLGDTARDFGADALNSIRRGFSDVLDRLSGGLAEAQRAVAP